MSADPAVTRRYSLGDLVVEWRASLCGHGGACHAGLPEVFDPGRKPWVDLSKADAERVREQVRQCPTGAICLGEDT